MLIFSYVGVPKPEIKKGKSTYLHTDIPPLMRFPTKAVSIKVVFTNVDSTNMISTKGPYFNYVSTFLSIFDQLSTLVSIFTTVPDKSYSTIVSILQTK